MHIPYAHFLELPTNLSKLLDQTLLDRNLGIDD